MFPNIKSPIALFLTSFALFLSGMLLVITHWPGTQLIIFVMIIVQAVAKTPVMLMFLTFRYPAGSFYPEFYIVSAGPGI